MEPIDVSRAQYEALRSHICDRNRCWTDRAHEDAGTVADVGQSWRLLLADKHFSNCATTREGGHCDLVAVRPQDSMQVVRLIEIKATPETGNNLQRKLDRTARAMLAVLPERTTLEAELHVKPLGKISIPYRFAPKVNGKRMPVRLFAAGAPL